jgi:hypothetical protein
MKMVHLFHKPAVVAIPGMENIDEWTKNASMQPESNPAKGHDEVARDE